MDLSEYIIGLLPVDNLKSQKLLYYCQGVHLARIDEPIFKDKIEAWQYGPVVPKVYNKYKKFGFDNIDKKDDKKISFKKEELKTISMVLSYYGKFSSLDLVNRTNSDILWEKAYNSKRNNVITNNSMKQYFKEIIEFN